MFAALAQWGRLSADVRRALASKFAVKDYRKGHHLAQPGAGLPFVLFICCGLLRFYTVSRDGRESNRAFVAENRLIGPFAGESPDWPAPYGLEALEDVVVMQAPMGDFRALCEHRPDFDHVVRRCVGAMLERKFARLRAFQEQSATERYRAFLAEFPDLVQRLPQYQIASYLGITDVSLSRIRRTVADEAVQ